MRKSLLVLLIAVLVLCSFYSFSFAFWPSGPNTKMIVAVLGLVWYAYDLWRGNKGFVLSQLILGGAMISVVYSVINVIAVHINSTNDYSYAYYISTYFVWLFSVYPGIALMRIVHGRVTLTTITYYLTALALFQSISAQLIEYIPAFDNFCRTIVFQTDFYDEVNRLRCFSVALDPAGVRFTLTLILIAVTLGLDRQVQQNRKVVTYLIIAFVLISALGNMVARTTSVGMAIGLAILLYYMMGSGLKIRKTMLVVSGTFTTIVILGAVIGVVLYNTDPDIRSQFRFAFEGFFSLVETGEFQTGSTDVLATMWKWPSTTQGWIIGTGYYGGFIYSTDIGYCRLILYSGLVGFVTFASLFVYLAYSFWRMFPRYWVLFLAYLACTFIVWWKVSTDILMIYAFFFWFTAEETRLIREGEPTAELEA